MIALSTDLRTQAPSHVMAAAHVIHRKVTIPCDSGPWRQLVRSDALDQLARSSSSHPVRLYSIEKGVSLLAPLRFIWNATRGHRFTPWRSEYLRWRVETFSGQRAETLTAKSVMSFFWASRWELLSFLAWTGQLDHETRKRP